MPMNRIRAGADDLGARLSLSGGGRQAAKVEYRASKGATVPSSSPISCLLMTVVGPQDMAAGVDDRAAADGEGRA
jgi:hypothetical protein